MRNRWRKTVTAMLTMSLAAGSFLGVTNVYAQSTNYVQDPSIVPSEQEQLQRKIVGYFPSWAYKNPVQGNFMVTDLQWDDLTHIQYSFAGVDPKTNKIFLLSKEDEKAAIGDDFSEYQQKKGPILHNGKEVKLDPTLPYKGHFNLLQVMKKQYPDVKVVISVGGWGASTGFYTMMDTDEGINTFADSCVEFIRKYNLDGIDIDFEYPTGTATAGNPLDQGLAESRRDKINKRYNLMMKTLRQKLDQAAKEDNKYYSLSAAVAASAWVLGGVTDGEYANYLDFLSVMSYDFHGAWNGYVGNLANIYMDPNDPETEGQARDYLAMEWAYEYYRGVLPPEKILMGIPYYTRGWEKVTKKSGAETGLYGTSIKTRINERGWGADKECNIWGDDDNGDGVVDGSGANPLWHVMNLQEANPNYVEYWDNVGKVPYIWNEKRATFLSFENQKSIKERAQFIEEKNLGGALIWVMNGDYDLNPNYDPKYNPETADRNNTAFNQEDVNKGKYTFGDTLTETLKTELDRMGPAKRTTHAWDTLQTTNVEVSMDVKYDHPNGTYTFTIINNTKEKIPGGWEIGFDFPKSADFTSSWGSEYKITPNGEFQHITLKGGGWNALDPGAKVQIQGMTKLCFSGIQHVTFNGLKPINWATGKENIVINTAPVISGVADVKLKVGSVFNPSAGVTAVDKEDGDLTAAIKITSNVDTSKVGSYQVTYTVADKEGLTTTKKATVVVEDQVLVNTAPVISGVTDVKLKVGGVFNPLAGVTAMDKEDGDLTAAIKITSNVDITKVGNYQVTYTVADKEGLTTTKQAAVVVENQVLVNTAPEIKGAIDVKLKVGGVFNPLAGITAMDKEDGDLTAAIKTTSNVDTTKAGSYQVTYTVADKEGLTATTKITVVVEDVVIPNGTYDASKVYNNGDKVTYNGKEYTAKWWTQGETPGVAAVWEQTPELGGSGVPVYTPGKAYVGGDIVEYNGSRYKANWWTNTTPGSDSSWVLVN